MLKYLRIPFPFPFSKSLPSRSSPLPIPPEPNMDHNIFEQGLHTYDLDPPISAARIQDFLKSLSVISLSDVPEGKCPICLEPFQDALDAERPVRLPCMHIMGEECLEKWLTSSELNRNNKLCPICRASLFERNHGPRSPLELRDYNARNPPDFQRDYDRLRGAIAERRREHPRTRDQNEQLEAGLAALRDRTNEPAVPLNDQRYVRRIDRDQRRAGPSDRRVLGHDYPGLDLPIRETESLNEQQRRENQAILARDAIWTHINQVSQAVRDREDSQLEQDRVWRLLQRGLDLERSFVPSIVNLRPTEPLLRDLQLQNRAMTGLRDRLARAGAAGRSQPTLDAENIFEGRRLGLPPLRPTVARGEAMDAALNLGDRVRFGAETGARSRPRAEAGALRHGAVDSNRTRTHTERTFAGAEQQGLSSTERLNRPDAASNLPGYSSGWNARRAQIDDSVERFPRPITEGPASLLDTPVPFFTPTPGQAATAAYSQTRFPPNSTTARSQEPAPRPQSPQLHQARSVRHQRLISPEDELRTSLARSEASTQQHQQQTRPTTPPSYPPLRQTFAQLPYTLPRFDASIIRHDAPFTSVTDPDMEESMDMDRDPMVGTTSAAIRAQVRGMTGNLPSQPPIEPPRPSTPLTARPTRLENEDPNFFNTTTSSFDTDDAPIPSLGSDRDIDVDFFGAPRRRVGSYDENSFNATAGNFDTADNPLIRLGPGPYIDDNVFSGRDAAGGG